MKYIVKRIILTFMLFIAVLFLFVLVSNYYFHAHGHNFIRVRGYDKEEPNSIDVVFIGSSDVFTGFAPGLAYDRTKITSYVYGVDAARVSLWKKMVSTCIENQSPKLLIVDIHGCCLDSMEDGFEEYSVRYLYDKVHIFENLKNELDYVFFGKEYDFLSYLLPGVYYHGLTCFSDENMAESNLLHSLSYLPLRGTITTPCIFTPNEVVEDYTYVESAPIGIDVEKYLLDFLDYCKNNGIENVLFVNMPTIIHDDKTLKTFQQSKYVSDIVTIANHLISAYTT